MNIAEKLKNTPKGTKLYSPMFGDVTFKSVNSLYIEVLDSSNIVRDFLHNGNFYYQGECMLFPSRDNRDWDNFHICPFKRGDFIVKECWDGDKFIAIFSHLGGPYEYTTNYLCLLRPDGKFKPKSDFGIGSVQEARLATDSEKKKLLDVIAKNGYYWDECSMTLNKLTLKFKFDINFLKPFDKVLVRDDDMDMWTCEIYSHLYNGNGFKYICAGEGYNQCIPYNDETKHLVGTVKDCPDYYKTW